MKCNLENLFLIEINPFGVQKLQICAASIINFVKKFYANEDYKNLNFMKNFQRILEI